MPSTRQDSGVLRVLWVLVVDDDPLYAEIVCRQVSLGRSFGLSFSALEPAETKRAALARIGAGGVDVAVVDLGLPDARGVEAVAAIATAFPELPMVVLTGDDTLGAEAIDAGAEGYLIKGQLGLGEALPRAMAEAYLRRRRDAVRAETQARLESLEERASRLAPPPASRMESGYALAASLGGLALAALHVLAAAIP